MPDEVRLRNATSEDEEFLFRLYCDTREEEMKGWGWPVEQKSAFLRMQFQMRARSYAAAYSSASNQIICVGENAVGRMLTARVAQSLCLVDIALLTGYCNHGIGSTLIEQLLTECRRDGLRLNLQVAVGNMAERLYRRFGFTEIARDAMYIQMQIE
jgi:ribosomal protein S18 acetylase RimI-like enzyme